MGLTLKPKIMTKTNIMTCSQLLDNDKTFDYICQMYKTFCDVKERIWDKKAKNLLIEWFMIKSNMNSKQTAELLKAINRLDKHIWYGISLKYKNELREQKKQLQAKSYAISKLVNIELQTEKELQK